MNSSLFNPLRFNLPVSSLVSTTTPNLASSERRVPAESTEPLDESTSTEPVAESSSTEPRTESSSTGAADSPASKRPPNLPVAKPLVFPTKKAVVAPLTTVLPPVVRTPRHSPRIVAEKSGSGFQLVIRSVLNIPLLSSNVFETEAQLQAAVDPFTQRSIDEAAYRIESADKGFVITLVAEDGTEMGRTRPVAGNGLAKATVRLIAAQARHASDAAGKAA